MEERRRRVLTGGGRTGTAAREVAWQEERTEAVSVSGRWLGRGDFPLALQATPPSVSLQRQTPPYSVQQQTLRQHPSTLWQRAGRHCRCVAPALAPEPLRTSSPGRKPVRCGGSTAVLCDGSSADRSSTTGTTKLPHRCPLVHVDQHAAPYHAHLRLPPDPPHLPKSYCSTY